MEIRNEYQNHNYINEFLSDKLLWNKKREIDWIFGFFLILLF